ncbi:uncharacterized protein B0H64DRAFT_20934 [Chaetomium fimeti]|uniref:Uncharacterized protein n=1 Tax=Chaetomium fimeti TaxID=1854472 RepID=A0AAE0HQ62_9PEZI|nr:hypothetical protein B0H64DRAFT_20934 [Chaetomium fimeti]
MPWAGSALSKPRLGCSALASRSCPVSETRGGPFKTVSRFQNSNSPKRRWLSAKTNAWHFSWAVTRVTPWSRPSNDGVSRSPLLQTQTHVAADKGQANRESGAADPAPKDQLRTLDHGAPDRSSEFRRDGSAVVRWFQNSNGGPSWGIREEPARGHQCAGVMGPTPVGFALCRLLLPCSVQVKLRMAVTAAWT